MYYSRQTAEIKLMFSVLERNREVMMKILSENLMHLSIISLTLEYLFSI